MTIFATVQGGNGKALARLRAGSGPRLKAANRKSADEFAALVKLAVPQDPEAKHGHLVDTVQEADVGEVGASVSIGDAERPYPLHLEAGHRARDGSHVPGKSFWFPAKRVIRKRSHDRILRAERAAIKAAATE